MDNLLSGRVGVAHPLVVTNSGDNSINATATATAEQILHGVIKSTSALATSITTPSVANIIASLGITPATYYDFVIDNSAGSNTVTLVLDASITAPVGAVTGGNTLTVTTTNKIGVFRLYFVSATAAVIYRMA